MKDLIVGFEFEGTRYGVRVIFEKITIPGIGDEMAYMAKAAELKSFSSPDNITGDEKLRIIKANQQLIGEMAAEHVIQQTGEN